MALDRPKDNKEAEMESTGGAIYSFHEYEMALEGTNRKNPRISKLEQLEKHLIETESEIVDPIAYLHKAYFGGFDSPRISIPALWENTRNIGLNFATSDGLHKMILSFGWVLPPNTELTEAGRATLLKNENNKAIMAGNLVSFNNALTSILGERLEGESNNFDIDYYNSLKKPIERVLFLLQIQKKDMLSISEISELGGQALMTAINTKLKEIFSKLRSNGIEIEDISISKGSIHNLLKKLNS